MRILCNPLSRNNLALVFKDFGKASALLHTQEVTGSSPVAPTIFQRLTAPSGQG